MDNELQIYIDGKFYPKSEAKVSVYDHGFLYGDGVFEGIRAYNGVVFKLKEHIDRLYRSAHAIMLTIPLTKQEMLQAVLDTLRKNKMQNSYIRLVVSRGIGDLGLDPRKCPKASVIIITDTIQCKASNAQETGITTIFSWVQRNPVNATTHEIKSLNYLNSILAKLEANAYGADEAMCLESSGCIAEGVGENVFIVKNGEIFTPPTSTGALSGITAEVVVGLAAKLGIKVAITNLTPFMLFTADEAFFTGTAMEMTPIREVNKRVIGDGKPGVVTKKLVTEFQKVIADPTQGTKI
ncbi:MAG: branched-chain-amino-acid transaminase [Candidatus Bathyarchaeota archaeon]|uniref:branched-chain-amino-acid transaminase n=1 Tax=Candidatus Bathycorpusculum sp. TaxID=2994959 RepID=UPI0028239604|nr:branched-chain-amino-acid transaminase [Candidatus Termiticorpusculum sp.]MCL2257605.1 branched-chain-amino-acid transaminase [Candidatus Termiticorpusculum sp.]MCL2292246.1 branched-chain-amino-acid transaminase [Candidatus Termiticorpusculum sp.]